MDPAYWRAARFQPDPLGPPTTPRDQRRRDRCPDSDGRADGQVLAMELFNDEKTMVRRGGGSLLPPSRSPACLFLLATSRGIFPASCLES